jgi:hypothetical protein
MHIVRERDATDAGPDAVVKLTVFESVLWRRVSQPPLGGAPARERRPPLPSPTPPLPPAAASEAVAATSSRGFEDGDGSRRFCAGILGFCP